MRARRWLICTALLALFGGAAPAAAQRFTPAFQSPGLRGERGVFVSGGAGPGDGVAVEGLWRRTLGEMDLGVRAGVADVGGAALLVGLDYRNPLVIADLPFDLSVTGAAQGILGSPGGVAIAAGAVGGATLVMPELSVTPYLHPRLALTSGFGDASGAELDLLVEAGAEFAFDAPFRVHLALGFGQGTAGLGLGLTWREDATP